VLWAVFDLVRLQWGKPPKGIGPAHMYRPDWGEVLETAAQSAEVVDGERAN